MITELTNGSISEMTTEGLMSARNEIISAMHIIHEPNLREMMRNTMSSIEVELSTRE